MAATFIAALVKEEDQRNCLERLVADACAGDRAALDRFLSLIQLRVFTFAFRLTGDHATAEDISQDALFRVCCKLDRYRPGTNLWAWIYRITVRLACDLHRRQDCFTALRDTSSHTVEDNMETREKMRHVLEAMTILTEKERVALVLIDMEGMTCGEAAAVMGCLKITARTRAAQARKRLRHALSGRYPELEKEK
jgi:RNA polymerase sigma-70 factor (ECF subfamily)